MRRSVSIMLAAALLAAAGCGTAGDDEMSIEERLDQYTSFRLEVPLDDLSQAQRQMIPLLIEVSEIMDAIFWEQAYGDRDSLLAAIDDERVRRFAEINYGPWDRLNGDEPFIGGVGPKPAGANFYPPDLTREAFEQAAEEDEALRSQYTVVRRDERGMLAAVPYHEQWPAWTARAARLLEEAAALAESRDLARYLRLRAEALRTDDYLASDMAWMEMKDNRLELVVGPIENYEDQLMGLKTAHEAFVLLKDMEWSARLARYAELLPELQQRLPVPAEYKQEEPGTGSDLGAYDAIYYAGDANAGSKTIAINLPNDEQVQLEKGTRRLQLKNAMRAKFDRILVPIAGVLVDEEQRGKVSFDAFFANTMFHEVAHGLGIKHTLGGEGTVREALADQYSALEEGKADVLGLFMVTQLAEMGEMPGADIESNIITFFASIFRSIRFGASSAHGRANLARFNYFKEMGAFQRDGKSGTYRVDLPRTREAMNALSERILRFQGDGDYQGVKDFMERYGVMGGQLRTDLDRLAAEGIPVDVTFEQGLDVLGLTPRD
ncbi:MAG: Zn-dependent hydrolase [bacterium]